MAKALRPRCLRFLVAFFETDVGALGSELLDSRPGIATICGLLCKVARRDVSYCPEFLPISAVKSWRTLSPRHLPSREIELTSLHLSLEHFAAFEIPSLLKTSCQDEGDTGAFPPTQATPINDQARAKGLLQRHGDRFNGQTHKTRRIHRRL